MNPLKLQSHAANTFQPPPPASWTLGFWNSIYEPPTTTTTTTSGCWPGLALKQWQASICKDDETISGEIVGASSEGIKSNKQTAYILVFTYYLSESPPPTAYISGWAR